MSLPPCAKVAALVCQQGRVPLTFVWSARDSVLLWVLAADRLLSLSLVHGRHLNILISFRVRVSNSSLCCTSYKFSCYLALIFIYFSLSPTSSQPNISMETNKPMYAVQETTIAFLLLNIIDIASKRLSRIAWLRTRRCCIYVADTINAILLLAPIYLLMHAFLGDAVPIPELLLVWWLFALATVLIIGINLMLEARAGIGRSLVGWEIAKAGCYAMVMAPFGSLVVRDWVAYARR